MYEVRNIRSPIRMALVLVRTIVYIVHAAFILPTFSEVVIGKAFPIICPRVVLLGVSVRIRAYVQLDTY